MKAKLIRLALAAVGLACCLPAAAQQSPARLTPYSRIWEQMAAAEDARARTTPQLNSILQTLRSNEPELRKLAVRALGRLERSELADTIAARLRDTHAAVRAEAAHALAQALSRGAPGARAGQQLSRALTAERDAAAAAAMAESLGRLRYASAAEARGAVAQLVPLLQQPDPTGALRGLFFLVRQPALRPTFDANARAAVLRVAAQQSNPDDAAQVHKRTVAAAVLISAGTDAPTLATLLSDRDPLVRREAAAALAARTDTAATAALVQRAMADSAGIVRLEGLRAYARRFAAGRGCAPVLAAVRDAHPHTALFAIDALGTSCARSARTATLLDSLVRTLPASAIGAWHPAAHALVAFAAQAPDSARQRLPTFVTHPVFFVRTYAATAATALRDTSTLRRLSQDEHPNVRTEAVTGLRRLQGHAAADVYLAQLGRDDSQLLMAASAALDSTTNHAVATALLDALDRVSAARRETSRDGRAALLARARLVGDSTLAARLEKYLTDFDPQIATAAADALQAWTGARPEPRPSAPPATTMPTFEEAAEIFRTRAVIQMADDGEVELELFPFDAPSNAARFVRLARAGYFDGLTFHRVAANFVVQGGSPNANEYAGDGPFTRDEVGLQNLRGMVGLSTRGRDTGDSQIYFNLIDNVRLDHDYTVFARVVRGMDVVDRMLEGAQIRKIVLR